VTTHWLSESLKARLMLFKNIKHLTTPILVLQASEDSIVSDTAQNAFCARLHILDSKLYPHKTPIIIEGALHEILFEQDIYRNNALGHITRWFDEH
jgi:lysophospholipase